ncbi:hypothetical protein D9M68_484980 [compost metagenome]
MAALAGTVEPLLGLLNVDATALARQQHARKLELRLSDTKGRRRLEIELPRLGHIRLDRAVGNAASVVAGKRDQRVDEIAGILRTRLHTLLGDLAVDLEGLEVVFGDTVAIGIHVGQSPAGAGMPLLRSVFVGLDGLVLAAVLVSGETELEEREGTGFLRDACPRIKGKGRHGAGPADRQRHAEYRNLQ